MTIKERLHKLVDELTELEADDALRILIARRKNGAPGSTRLARAPSGGEEEWQTVPLPEGWGETLTGEPMPDVAAAVRRSREGH
jgi:hypothetical protein